MNAEILHARENDQMHTEKSGAANGGNALCGFDLLLKRKATKQKNQSWSWQLFPQRWIFSKLFFSLRKLNCCYSWITPPDPDCRRRQVSKLDESYIDFTTNLTHVIQTLPLTFSWCYKDDKCIANKTMFCSNASQTFFDTQPLYSLWSLVFTVTSPLLHQKSFNWPLGSPSSRLCRQSQQTLRMRCWLCIAFQ